MKLRVKIFLFFFLSTFSFLFGQNDSTKNVEQILEILISDTNIEEDNPQLYDLIEQYVETPINLNNVTKSELLKLPFLNIESVNATIEYRNTYGNIFTYSELADKVSSKTLMALKAFTFLSKNRKKETLSFFKNTNVKFRTRALFNLQESEGFKSGYYDGSPLKLYNRLIFNINPKINFGVLTEKDAGEKSYFDFHTFYFQAKDLLNGLTITGGYYTVEFGQGLALWSPYSFAKSSDATNSIIKRARGVTPYRSTGEFLFMKGGAVKYSNKYFNLSTFYSLDNSNYLAPSKNTFGGIASILPFDNIKLSMLYFQRNKNTSTKDLVLQDSIEQHLSFSHKLTYQNLLFTGEFSFHKNSIASINTLQLSLLKTFLIVASIRNYPKDYNSYYSQGFGETKRTSNEFGIYLGFKWRSKLGIINLYFDQFKFPSPTSAILLPSLGSELSLSYEASPFPHADIYLRYFYEQKEVLKNISSVNTISDRRTNKFRTDIIFEASRNLNLKSRIELLYLDEIDDSKKGILLFQDVKYTLPSILRLQGRIIFFQTDNFASRIYEFENDLSGVMTNQPLWGTGVKWYLLIRYNPYRQLYISAKFSELYKPNESSLGSGNNLIDGNINNKLSIQIDYTF